jgi:hypothetical protein
MKKLYAVLPKPKQSCTAALNYNGIKKGIVIHLITKIVTCKGENFYKHPASLRQGH